MNLFSIFATKAGGPCVNTIHLFRRACFSAQGKKKNLKEVFEMITCFYFLLPTTSRNEMISHLDRWENHCLMPAGRFLCSSSHFKHNMQQLSRMQRTTFNLIHSPTVVLCAHHAGESGTAPVAGEDRGAPFPPEGARCSSAPFTPGS